MIAERQVQPPAPIRARPAACLDCPDCRGTCWEAVALRTVPDCILHRRREGRG